MCMYTIPNIEKDFATILENLTVNRNLMVEKKMRVHALIVRTLARK